MNADTKRMREEVAAAQEQSRLDLLAQYERDGRHLLGLAGFEIVEQLPDEEEDQTFKDPGNAFEEFLASPVRVTQIHAANLQAWLDASDEAVGLDE